MGKCYLTLILFYNPLILGVKLKIIFVCLRAIYMIFHCELSVQGRNYFFGFIKAVITLLGSASPFYQGRERI